MSKHADPREGHTRRLPGVWCATWLAIAGMLASVSAATFIEEAGLVCIEAESYTTVDQRTDAVVWGQAADNAGYGGTGYMMTPDNGSTTTDWTTGTILTYEISFQSPGTYYFWYRRWVSGNYVDDSFILGYDGAMISDRVDNGGSANPNQWHWRNYARNYDSIRVTEPGLHTLQVVSREDGYALDRILLTTDGSYDPSTVNGGVGPAESRQQGALYTLSITNDGNGTTDPAGDVQAEADVPVTVSATPNTGYAFSAWTVAAGSATFGDAAAAQTTVTLSDQNATIQATFTALPSYTLTVGNDGNGTTTPDDAVTAYQGVATDISATPNAGYLFDAWTVTAGTATIADAAAAQTTVTLDSEDATVQATFSLIPSDLTLTVDNDGNGTTTPAGATTVQTDVATSISATPNTGYAFDGWTVTAGEAIIADAAAAQTEVTLSTVDATVQANFVVAYTLTVTSDANGTTTPDGAAVAKTGIPVDITATPNAGYAFAGWTVEAGTATIADEAAAQTTVTLDTEDATVRANFVAVYTLTVSNDGNGTTQPDGATEVWADVPADISATPATHYRFAGWTVVSGTATFADETAAQTTVTLSSGSAEVQATFALLPSYTLTLVADAAMGTVTPADPTTVDSSIATPIVATPGADYVFVQWTVESGTATVADPSAATTTVALASDAQVRAELALAPPSVTTQPIDTSIMAGETATFSVVATGPGTITYQWRKDGVAIDGATEAGYTTPAAVLDDDGALFSCVVTNEGGSITTDTVMLSVCPTWATTIEVEDPTTVVSANVEVKEWGGATVGDFNSPTGDYIEWNCNAAAAETYRLDWRYDNGHSAARPLALSVNGVVVDTVEFTPNPPWIQRFTITPGYYVDLAAGANTIRLTAIGSNGGCIDYMRVAPLVEPPVTVSLKVYVKKGVEATTDSLVLDTTATEGDSVQLVAPSITDCSFLVWRALSGTVAFVDSAQATTKLAAAGEPLEIVAVYDQAVAVPPKTSRLPTQFGMNVQGGMGSARLVVAVPLSNALVTVTLTDLRGRVVARLVDGPMAAGYHAFNLNVERGLYLCTMRSTGFKQVVRVMP